MAKQRSFARSKVLNDANESQCPRNAKSSTLGPSAKIMSVSVWLLTDVPVVNVVVAAVVLLDSLAVI
jgi:hypothetical protein